jgi:hypothetical protein
MERIRDYKHEYELRRKRTKRLFADMNKDKADAIKQHLDERGQTFVSWLENQIDKELKRG